MFKMIISPGVFFFNFKILVFKVVRELKGQRMAQNDKDLSVAPYISGTIYQSYDLHLWCICMYEIIISKSKF